MKVIRSKEVSKVRIVGHNKKVLYWIVFLIIVLIGTLIAIRVLDEESVDVRDSCVVDGDCVIVNTNCCPCESGGEEICVNKDSDLANNNLECPDNLVCPQVFNCKQTPCKCVDGKCSF